MSVVSGIGAGGRERPDELCELSARIDMLVDAIESSGLVYGP